MPPRVASPCAARKQRQLCVAIVQIKWQLCELYQLCLELMFQHIQRRGKCSPSEFRLLHKSKSNFWPAQSCANCGAHWTPTHMATHTRTHKYIEHIVHTHTHTETYCSSSWQTFALSFPFQKCKVYFKFCFCFAKSQINICSRVFACVCGRPCVSSYKKCFNYLQRITN